MNGKAEDLACVDIAYRAIDNDARDTLLFGAHCKDFAPAIVVWVSAVIDNDDVTHLAIKNRIDPEMCDRRYRTGCNHANRHCTSDYFGTTPLRDDPMHCAARNAYSIKRIA
jgi:hypothetical protein